MTKKRPWLVFADKQKDYMDVKDKHKAAKELLVHKQREIEEAQKPLR